VSESNIGTPRQLEQLFKFDYGEWRLYCPECGGEWVHIDQAFALESSDPHRESKSQCGELFGVPVGGVTPESRGALVIKAWCEFSHQLEIQLFNHKGYTFIKAGVLEDEQLSNERTGITQ
jgi:hypothetical protein